MTRLLFAEFPREIAFPNRQLVKDEKTFYDLINVYNKQRRLYFALYSCDENRKYDQSEIDKLFFDFDVSETYTFDKAIADVIRLSDHFLTQKLKHTIVFSGKKGFHVYVFTKNGKDLTYRKDTVYNSHLHYQNLLKINSDTKVWDLPRIARIPNSWHPAGQKYCIPISREDLKLGIAHIHEKAKNQQTVFFVYGAELLDLKQFDKPSERTLYADIPLLKTDITITDATIKRFLPCIQHWLTNAEHPTTKEPMGTWEGRYYFAVACRTMGLTEQACDQLAKKYFGEIKRKDDYPTNYVHFKKHKVLQFAYERGDFFPNCLSLWARGLCPGKCPKYKEKGSPLYR